MSGLLDFCWSLSMLRFIFRLFAVFRNMSRFASSRTRAKTETQNRFCDASKTITNASPVENTHRALSVKPDNFSGQLFSAKKVI